MRNVIASDVLRLPTAACFTVSTNQCDINGHFTVRHQLASFDDAAWNFLNGLGLGLTRMDHGRTFFDLEQHLTYRAEAQVMDALQIHCRLLDISSSTAHIMSYLVRPEDDVVISTLETLTLNVELAQRQSTPFTNEEIERLSRRAIEDRRLAWASGACGAMQVRKSRLDEQ